MITEEQLHELGFKSNRIGVTYYNDNWEYEFNINNNKLIFYNDGFPEDEPLVIIKDFQHFKQVIESLGI